MINSIDCYGNNLTKRVLKQLLDLPYCTVKYQKIKRDGTVIGIRFFVYPNWQKDPFTSPFEFDDPYSLRWYLQDNIKINPRFISIGEFNYDETD